MQNQPPNDQPVQPPYPSQQPEPVHLHHISDSHLGPELRKLSPAAKEFIRGVVTHQA
jgi:hypothetical protein